MRADGISLTVTRGEKRDVGRVVILPVGACVMVGRAADISRSTGMITYHSLARLDEEDQAAMARHLKARAARAPTRDGARTGFASFDRKEDIGLGDDSVSTRHAMLFCDEAGLTVLDMGSTNGTFRNGERVISTDLSDGDVLRLGETRFSIAAR